LVDSPPAAGLNDNRWQTIKDLTAVTSDQALDLLLLE
jgi:hypothetical protein